MRFLIATVVMAVSFVAPSSASAPKLTTLIAETEVSLWRCQDQMAVARTEVSTDPWSLPRSTAYRRWVLHLWAQRLRGCHTALHAHDATVARLNRGLAGSPMAGLGAVLERVGRKRHVSPYFMAAAAATESTLGAKACSNNHMNVWGLSSCGGGWYVPPPCSPKITTSCWHGWAEAIDFYAQFLIRQWPNATSTYSFHGYARCSSCWGAKTAGHMARLFGVGNDVRYRPA